MLPGGDNHLLGADFVLQLGCVERCDGPPQLGQTGAGQIAAAGAILRQSADDLRMRRKAGFAKSQVVDRFPRVPQLANAFVNVKCGRRSQLVANRRREDESHF